MTETERKAYAARFFDAIVPTVEMLAERWLDEAEYEDIGEYQKVLAREAASFPAVTITAMSKRPFGFTFTLAGCTYAIRATARTIEYQLVGRPRRVMQ